MITDLIDVLEVGLIEKDDGEWDEGGIHYRKPGMHFENEVVKIKKEKKEKEEKEKE